MEVTFLNSLMNINVYIFVLPSVPLQDVLGLFKLVNEYFYTLKAMKDISGRLFEIILTQKAEHYSLH